MLRSHSGVSLIEIMIALVLLGFGVTSIMRMLPESNAATTRARNLTKATNLAQQKLEQLMSRPFDDPLLSNGTHVDTENPIDGHFNRAWTVQNGTPVAGMKTLVVRVTFPTASADSTVAVNTIVSSRW